MESCFYHFKMNVLKSNHDQDYFDFLHKTLGRCFTSFYIRIHSKNSIVNNFRNDILKVLAYFDMFHYPISEKEIILFLPNKTGMPSLSKQLHQLTLDHIIFRFGDFYTLHNDLQLIHKRLAGNRRAAADLLIAYRISKFLYRFPFVRAVSISGSLSKNFSDPKSDIDYFIITSSGRLWVARTFLHLFKKLTFLSGVQHHYCMNYFIDEEALEIEEKNIFTAIETVTLLPICGNRIHEDFFSANHWTDHFLPNCRIVHREKYYTGGKLRFKKMTEFVLNNRLGTWMDDQFMKITSRRWEKKDRKCMVNIKGNRMGIICGKHCCKPNPVYFQNEILMQYQRKIERLRSESFVLNKP